MTAPQLPDPLVPAEVNLQDFGFIPLHIKRLQQSKAWLKCKRRPELAFYLMNLWMRAWHEHPAGSIEADDDVLADAAMCPPRLWPKLRDDLLRGWIECSDGRRYHPVVAELAMGAWAEKLAQRARTKAATDAKKAKKTEAGGQRNVGRQPPDVQRNDQRDDQRHDHQGIGKGQGQGEVRETSPPSSASTQPLVALTRHGEIALLLRRLASEKGKTVRIGAIDRVVIDWAARGVSDAHITAAFADALQDRELKHDASAITAGFVDVFLAKILNPQQTGSRVTVSAPDWWETYDAIIAKARELGVEPEPNHPDLKDSGASEFDKVATLCQIIAVIGDGPWVDKRNVAHQRALERYHETHSTEARA